MHWIDGLLQLVSDQHLLYGLDQLPLPAGAAGFLKRESREEKFALISSSSSSSETGLDIRGFFMRAGRKLSNYVAHKAWLYNIPLLGGGLAPSTSDEGFAEGAAFFISSLSESPSTIFLLIRVCSGSYLLVHGYVIRNGITHGLRRWCVVV